MRFVYGSFVLVAVMFLTLGVVGCGGSGEASPEATSTSSTETSQDVEPEVGEEHVVKMVGDHTGFYYEPDELTIEPGDKVIWEMESGAPHNVSFRDQEIPTEAQSLLEKNDKLVSENFSVPGQSYEIHFTEDYPTGEYNYICEPHVSSGMDGKLTIK